MEIAEQCDFEMTDVQTPANADILVSASLADVEADWRALEAAGIESPGQSYDFLHHWTNSFGTRGNDLTFVSIRAAHGPIAVMALRRFTRWGVCIMEPLAGHHVGVAAPLIDAAYFAGLSASARSEIWRALAQKIDNADVIYFCGVPEILAQGEQVFAEMGLSVSGDNLYRSAFADWQQCDQTQRTRSRRKRDRYRVGKLEAIGALSLETINADGDYTDALEEMFDQRGIRFTEQGIVDPFADPTVRAFYAAAFQGGEGLSGRLHVFRVDGRPAAIRYNLVAGSRLFCLISSMSAEPDLRDNSPGKVGLTRILEQEFSGEVDLFDFGVGLNDEKRIWCNVKTPVRHHYLPLTERGRLFSQMHRVRKGIKSRIKSNAKLLVLLRSVRARLWGCSAHKDANTLD